MTWTRVDTHRVRRSNDTDSDSDMLYPRRPAPTLAQLCIRYCSNKQQQQQQQQQQQPSHTLLCFDGPTPRALPSLPADAAATGAPNPGFYQFGPKLLKPYTTQNFKFQREPRETGAPYKTQNLKVQRGTRENWRTLYYCKVQLTCFLTGLSQAP